MIHGEPTPSTQPSSAWLCTTHLMLHAITANRNIPVPSCLAYSAEDPYTVYLDSHTDTEIPVTWALSRELLTAGTRQRAGVGAVTIYPGHGDDTGSLYLLLAAHDGTRETDTVLLRAQVSDVEAFLRWSEHIVPSGQESRHLDLDQLIRQLLDQGPDA